MSADGQSFPNSGPRTRASLLTTASGIADSVLSNGSFVTDESFRLSRFPLPPPSIPPSPVKGNDSNPTTPTSRTFDLHSRSTSTQTQPPTAYPSRAQTPSNRRDGQTEDPTTPPASSRPLPAPNLGSLPPVPPFRFPQSQSPPERPGQRDRRDIAEQVPSSPKSQASLSPYDWHEGSSSISVDPSEERLLSTAFITGLLAPPRSNDGEQRHQDVDPSIISSSGFSEISYPPPSTYGLRYNYTPSPLAGAHQHEPMPDTLDVPHAPPPSYDAVTPSGRSTSASNRTFGEGQSQSDVEREPSIRTAPRVARKVSLMGITPAELQRLPPHDRQHTSSPSSGTGSNPFTFDSTTPLFPRDGQRILSAVHEVDAMSRDSGIEMDLRTSDPPAPNVSRSTSFNQAHHHDRRQSMQSTRSTATSFISRISNSAIAQRSARMIRQTRNNFRIKPLPPVPTIPDISITQEQSYRQIDNDAPLPQLAQRANMLTSMLDAGRLPHQSVLSYDPHTDTYRTTWDPTKFGEDPTAYASGMRQSVGGRKRGSLAGMDGFMDGSDGVSPSKEKTFFAFRQMPQARRTKILVISVVLVALVVVGIVVGVVVGRKKKSSGLPSCSSSNVTGNNCDLDATCVCTSTGSSSCNALAQNLFTLTPFVNSLFNVNFTTDSVATAMFAHFGSPVNNDCRNQAVIVDVAPGLDSSTFPNRTTWAQAALLWSFVQSQNATEVGALQGFVQDADWSSLSSGDGPVYVGTQAFQTTKLGYTYDFAQQTVKPPSKSFQTDGEPSSDQITQVSTVANGVLDRMYSFAFASSTQRETAMLAYWQTELGLEVADYSEFVSFVESANILLPFDATAAPGGQNISSLLTNSTSDPFPPPLACYPGLTSDQETLLNSVETTVFALGESSSPSTFDTDCYSDRPIYGVLDILQLRLPFSDTTANVSRQAVVLKREVLPRSVVYNGALLSTLPDGVATTPSSSALDAREFGTTNQLNHVLLNFFKAIGDISLAQALVKWVLEDSPTPPSNDTTLGQNLDKIPLLEVAVFGSITPGDVNFVVSSFATPTGGLFFGSDGSLAVRDFAINAVGQYVAWADSTLANEIVHDNTFSEDAFNAVWNPAFLFFHSENNQVVTVDNITSSFTLEKLFSTS